MILIFVVIHPIFNVELHTIFIVFMNVKDCMILWKLVILMGLVYYDDGCDGFFAFLFLFLVYYKGNKIINVCIDIVLWI